MKKIPLILILPFLALGCNKSPYDRTTGGVVTGSGTGPAPGSLVIYYNELSSGGDVSRFPGQDNQTLSFLDSTPPTISNHSILFSWTGAPAAPGQPNFVGFDLIHAATVAGYAADPGVNLAARGFTKVTFFARGSLSANTIIKIQVTTNTPQPCLSFSATGTGDDPNTPCGKTAQLTSTWQPYTIALPPGSLNPVKDFFLATFIYTVAGTGSGGTVYFDRIEYEP